MKTKLLLIAILTLSCWNANSQSQQGPNNPGNAQNTSCPFFFSSPTDYLPANNVMSSDNVYATASHCDCCDMNTRCLETKGYGFNIPLTATITGILAEVEKKGSPNSNMQDNPVHLMKAGNVVGTSQALPSTWPMTDTYFSYGGSSNLWGTTWTPADINDPNFGLAFASISYTCFGNNNPVISSIDHIRITVFYNNLTSILAYQPTSFTLYPNPSADGTFSISGELPVHEVHVFNIKGESVGKEDLAAGFYTVRILSENKMYFQRLVVTGQN